MGKRIRLDDRQCGIFRKDMVEFGYKVTTAEIRKIADMVAEGTHDEADPIARIMAKQIDDAMEAVKSRRDRW